MLEPSEKPVESVREVVRTPSSKMAYWRRHFENWKVSGLTQAAYCRKHGLKWFNFHYWKKKIQGKSPTGRLRLVPIGEGSGPTVGSAKKGIIRICLKEIRVEVDGHIDSGSLKSVQEIVERWKCGA